MININNWHRDSLKSVKREQCIIILEVYMLICATHGGDYSF
jgi:hypothetical protein